MTQEVSMISKIFKAIMGASRNQYFPIFKKNKYWFFQASRPQENIILLVFRSSLIFMMLMANTTPLLCKERILIVYFTWADNTVITNRTKAVKEANRHVSSMERKNMPDTVTSASVLPPGNTAKLAGWIREEVGGDLHSIKVKNKYSSYYTECLSEASKEKAKKARPLLVDTLPDLSNYDVIFIGFPNWWSTMPMAVLTFLESHDFSNLTVIPFVSHGTGGIARTVIDLKKALPKSTVVKQPIGIYRSETDKAKKDIQLWLKELGY